MDNMTDVPVVKYDESDTHELFHYLVDGDPSAKPSVVRGFVSRKRENESDPLVVKAISHHVEQPIIVKRDETIKDVLKSDNDFTYTRGYESTAIRVWKDGGVVYTSTHKRIDPINSRWGSSLSFSDMYRYLGGPTEELFDSNEESSDNCYVFLMVHPKLMIGSFDPASNYIVFVGTINVNTPCMMYPPFDIPNCVTPETFTLTEADSYLQNGWGKQPPLLGVDGVLRDVSTTDPRLGTGEFVIATEWSGVPWNSNILGVYQLLSESYNFRCSVRNNNPNLWNRLFTLSNNAHLDINDYAVSFPWISSVMPADLNGVFEFYNSRNKLNTKDVTLEESTAAMRLYNVWNVFLYILPHGLKQEVTTNIHAFHVQRHNISKWITGRYTNGLVTDRRIGQIVEFAYKLMQNGQNPCKNLQSAVQLVLRTERGESLYRLWSMMNEENARHIENIV